MKKHMSDQVKIGCVTAKNRIVVPPMVCFQWSDDTGRPTQRNLEHYRAMAAGGAGLIIAEATCVNKEGRLDATQLGLWSDDQIPGWKKITDAVHAFGTPFFVQLHHAGVTGIEADADCPSDYFRPAGRRHEVRGHAMSHEKVLKVIDDFVRAACRAKEAGFDGVELHGCHSYLICQFLNRKINHRTDEYGRSERFALDIIRGIRKACGSDFVVGIRLGAFEPELEDGLRNAAALKNDVDFFNVSYGFAGESTPVKPEGFAYSEAVYGAKRIKEIAGDVPVFAVDGILDGEMVQGAIDETGADMVNVARGFLVNYNFANDVLAGQDCGKCLHCKPACRWSPFLLKDGNADCPGRKLFLKKKLG